MPIYQYECKICGEKFEHKQDIAEGDKNMRCPKCGAKVLKRIFSTFITESLSSSGTSATSQPT